ncbi:MAG: PBP1A family penicillin-binding protein [Nitrospirota bacterium]
MTRLEQDLKKAERRSISKRIITGLIIFSALTGILGGFVYWAISDLPNIKLLEEYTPIESSRVYSSDGKIIAELYLERRTFIPHYQIPDHVKKAFVSVEDIRFYTHPGVDFIGILRALWHDIKAGGIVEGGSTITQQLARMLFLKPDRSIKRKIKEAALSIQIEKRYTKDEILGMYLNQAYFGTRAYGIEAAAQTYFGKSARYLNIAEAALLASLPKAPSTYSPFKNPEKAKERRTMVLKQMLNHKFIKKAQYEEAEKVPLPLTPHFRKYDAPYFIETLRQSLETKYGNELYTSGYKIYSTLDSIMQQIAEESVKKGISSIEKRVKSGVEAALIAIDMRTGYIKAMVGGSNFWKNQFNRVTQALRQPGSAFKPFVYVTAIENGMTSNDIINDAPISFLGSRPGQLWIPKNYDGKYHGNVTLKTALAKSLNAATIRLASHLGINSVINTAHRFGIKGNFQPYLPTAIGASTVTLFDTVYAYSVFSSGYRVKPLFYERIVNRDGIIVEETKPVMENLLTQKTVEEMKVLLRAIVEEGTAYRAKEIKRLVYGKTGTTNDYIDAWFIGFDDRLAVGVWVGRDNHKPIGSRETGARAALPIWIDFMKKAPLQTLLDQNP